MLSQLSNECDALESLELIETLAFDRVVDPAGNEALKELDRWESTHGASSRFEALRAYLILRAGGTDALVESLKGNSSKVAVVMREALEGEADAALSEQEWDADLALARALVASAKGEHRESLGQLEEILEREPWSHSIAWAAAE
jgi:hypothetical protein